MSNPQRAPRSRGVRTNCCARCPCRRESSRAEPGSAAHRARRTARSAASCPAGSGSSISSQPSWVEPFGPAWPSCRPIFALLLVVHEVDDALPGARLRVVPRSGAARRDARVGRHAGHLREHQARAAQRARTQVHQVEVVGHAVARRSTSPSATPPRGSSASGRVARNGVNIGGTGFAGRPRAGARSTSRLARRNGYRADAGSRDRCADCR